MITVEKIDAELLSAKGVGVSVTALYRGKSMQQTIFSKSLDPSNETVGGILQGMQVVSMKRLRDTAPDGTKTVIELKGIDLRQGLRYSIVHTSDTADDILNKFGEVSRDFGIPQLNLKVKNQWRITAALKRLGKSGAQPA